MQITHSAKRSRRQKLERVPSLGRGRGGLSPFDTLAMWLAIAVDRPLVDVVLGLESLDLVAQEFLSKQCAARILWSRLKSDFKAHG